ncbi:MAG: type II toxin-antitoxin system VapC family toxin [Actinomycetota bacterium]
MEYQRLENGENRDSQFLIREPLVKSYIIDASVCIKWFSVSNEKNLDKSNALRDYYYQRKILLAAPDLLIYEIGNALSLNPNFNKDNVIKAVNSLYQMEIILLKANRDIMAEAVKLKFEKDITVYDAVYVAIARKFNLQFITADQKLYNKVKDIGCSIYLPDLKL